MSVEGIVSGQKVSEEKRRLARELRRRMTAKERILWKHLRGDRLQSLHFRRQQIIYGFIVDFYCHAGGLVVELDGEVHKAQAEYDAERDHLLTGRGLRVVRIPNEEVRHDIGAVLTRITALAAQPGTPAVPPEAPVIDT
jgi:very-short-patch-repair endonuclease